MGRSRTPAYRLELAIDNGIATPSGWDVGGKYGKGKPTAENVTKYVKAFEASCAPGGCNEHLGRTTVLRAKLVRQSDNTVVATYEGSVTS